MLEVLSSFCLGNLPARTGSHPLLPPFTTTALAFIGPILERAMPEEIRKERHQVTGEKLLQTIKNLVHEGNIRRIIIKDDSDRTIIEIPLTIGVVSAILLPAWVALGAIAALAADLTIEVERVGGAKTAAPASVV